MHIQTGSFSRWRESVVLTLCHSEAGTLVVLWPHINTSKSECYLIARMFHKWGIYQSECKMSSLYTNTYVIYSCNILLMPAFILCILCSSQQRCTPFSWMKWCMFARWLEERSTASGQLNCWDCLKLSAAHKNKLLQNWRAESSGYINHASPSSLCGNFGLCSLVRHDTNTMPLFS